MLTTGTRLLVLPAVGVLLLGAGQLTARSAAAVPLEASAARAHSAPASAHSSSAASNGVTDPTVLDKAFFELWNAQRLDEMAALFTDDMVYVLPNHEPVKGATAVVELYRKLRPVLGEFASGAEIHKAVRTKDTYSRSVSYTLKNGVRINDAEIVVRQSDGTWRYAVCQTGLRDPLR